MKLKIAVLLALGMVLSACSAQAASVQPIPAERAAASSGGENPPSSACDAQEMITQLTVFQAPRRDDAGSGRDSIVKTFDGREIDRVDIYAELCTLKLEPSYSGSFEVAFSYPKAAKPNYDNHFELGITRQDGNTLAISTDYENGRWDAAFVPIGGFDGDQYRKTAVLTVKVPQKQLTEVSLHIVTAGSTLNIMGIDTAALDIRIGTGDVVINTDRAYRHISVEHVVGDVTLRMPELGRRLDVSSKIGVFTLSLPAESADLSLDIQYDAHGSHANDEAICILPVTWTPTISANAVHYMQGDGSNSIVVKNKLYGVFAVQLDDTKTGEPISARQ